MKTHWLCRLLRHHKWGTWTMDYDCCLRCGPETHGPSEYVSGNVLQTPLHQAKTERMIEAWRNRDVR